jgi:hypothetical protein
MYKYMLLSSDPESSIDLCIYVNCQSVLDRDINAAINILNRWDDGDCLSARS